MVNALILSTTRYVDAALNHLRATGAEVWPRVREKRLTGTKPSRVLHWRFTETYMESGRFRGVRFDGVRVGLGKLLACLNLPYRLLRFINFA